MTIEELQNVLPARYRVQREIGRGGMATVYLAEDVVEARDVAVKVLNAEFTSSVDATRFIREIEIAGELVHPNILPAYDSGNVDGTLFYVMPFVTGQSVRARLDVERQFSIDEAIRITCEVCEALEYAHERNIIHRDIKPENILLQAGRAMVADFGIARVAEQGNTITQTGFSLGTTQYMSPEQASAEKVDRRSDIYSLACVLYEMLAGEPPFTGPNPMAVLARSITQQVPSVRVARSSVPESVEFAIMQALEKAPVDRFGTAGEFSNALLNGEVRATGARPRGTYTAAYRAAHPPRPTWRRRRVVVFASAAVLLIASASGALVMRHRHTVARAAANADGRRMHPGAPTDTSRIPIR